MGTTEQHSDKLKKAWRRAVLIYRRGHKSGKVKKPVFYGSTMKIFMDLVKSDPSLRDEFIRTYGRDPRDGAQVLLSSVDPTVANREFPISLGITSKQSLEVLK